MGFNRSLVVLALAAMALSGCQKKPDEAAKPAPATAGAYFTPPSLVQASRLADGSVHLDGVAAPGAMVTLRSPDGAKAGAPANNDGAWSMDLPPAETPRLFAFDAASNGQTVRGEGALALIPAPGVAALVLRAGFAAAPSGKSATRGLQLISFDYDGGGAAVGGFAPAGSDIRLIVDGVVVGDSRADGDGRFSILAIDPRHSIAPGHHAIRLETRQNIAVETQVDLQAPSLPPDKPFTAARTTDGWLVNWSLPGGGAQSSLVFDSALGAPMAPAVLAPAPTNNTAGRPQ